MDNPKSPFRKEYFKKRKAKKRDKAKQDKEENSKSFSNFDKIFNSNKDIFNKKSESSQEIIEEDDKCSINEALNDDWFGYYRIMNVEISDTQETIKQAYKKKLLIFHPDKGGNSDHFKYLKEAYNVLSKDEHKQIYDHFGRSKLQEVLANSDSNSLQQLINLIKLKELKENRFSYFHDSGLSTLCEVNKLKTSIPTIKSNIKVSLNDVYVGQTINTIIKAARPCINCKGKGIEPQGVVICKCCNGSGEMHIPKYMNICSQKINSHVKCEQCRGLGEIVIVNKICNQCKGKRHQLENVNLSIKLDKGIHDGHIYTLRQQGHEYIEGFKGDVILEISIKSHKFFKCVGYDLYIEKTISLCDALCGVSFELKHLDSKKYTIKSKENKIISNNKFTVEKLGMPVFNEAEKYGNLIIIFIVKFPTKVDCKEKKLLKSIFYKNSLSKNPSKNAKIKKKNNLRRRLSQDEPNIIKILDESSTNKTADLKNIAYCDNFNDSHITKYESNFKNQDEKKSDCNKSKTKCNKSNKGTQNSYKTKQYSDSNIIVDDHDFSVSETSEPEDLGYLSQEKSDLDQNYFKTFDPSVHSYDSNTNNHFCNENIQCKQQ